MEQLNTPVFWVIMGIFTLLCMMFVMHQRALWGIPELPHDPDNWLGKKIGGDWTLHKGEPIKPIKNTLGKKKIVYFVTNPWVPNGQVVLLEDFV